MNYDFIKPELEFIKANANFDERQAEIFDRLTDKHR
jgi:hypothetical protein